MRAFFSRARHAGVVGVAVGSFTVVTPAFSRCEDLTFAEARDRLRSKNETVTAAARFEEERRQEQSATRGLRRPRVDLGARFTRIDEPITIDLDPIRTVILQLHPTVPPAAVPPFVQPVQDEEFWKAELRLTWPLFTGGRISAANKAAGARLADAQQQRHQVEDAVTSELVRRYFGVRLARRVLDVRAQVVDGLERHLHQASRLEEEGFISRAERLHAEVARAEAGRQQRRASQDLELARTALGNTLATPDEVDPVSPLFVLHEVESLGHFQGLAQAAHPGLGRAAAQRELAHQGVRAEKAAFLPEVFAFGVRELHEEDLTLLEPTWAVGVAARVTLLDGGERRGRLAAARLREERAALLARKAARDVGTLVEKAYRELLKARDQFDTLESTRTLAEENLRTRTRAFEEGFATSLEVVDARLSLARVELERLAAAYDFCVALADLLEASGQSARFEEYRARADLEVDP